MHAINVIVNFNKPSGVLLLGFYTLMNTQDIWNKYAKDLKVFILSKTKDTPLTEDILQDVFIKIHTKKNSLKDESSLKSWLFSIANHTMMDVFRKQSKTKLANELEKESLTENTSIKEHNPQDCMLPLILRLPKKYKDVLFLASIKGMKQAEIAEQLKISLPATKSRILRGRELLKQGFMACCSYTLDENGHLKGEHQNIEDCKVCRPQPL